MPSRARERCLSVWRACRESRSRANWKHVLCSRRRLGWGDGRCWAPRVEWTRRPPPGNARRSKIRRASKRTRRHVGARATRRRRTSRTSRYAPARPALARLILPLFFSLLPSPVSLSREWPFGGGPPLTRRPHLSPRPAQDDVLEVVFGHLARISTPKEYFNAMLTCVRHPRRARFFHPRLELRPTCGSRGLLTRHRPSRPGRHPRKRHPRD